MFRGFAALNLDIKGRLTLPTKIRDPILEACAGKLVVTIDQSQCLNIYPLPKWEEIEAQLEKAETSDDAVIAFKRLYVGHAAEVEMDAQGRISLPVILREWAALDKKVMLIGQIYKFELWDEQAWFEHNKQNMQDKKEGRLKLPADLKVAF